MQVICLEEKAFYELVEQVVERLKEKNNVLRDKWVSNEEAMRLLNVKSKTTLQKLRDEGKIRFSQPEKKIILYDTDSINSYLEKNSRDTF
ncbi:helix-turn-helix domain-containing protein [Flavobacterium supellecticarium]|uniref:Helix-turn-helix domain-containing protein n=1 Tax=Flavobacterium supellecticarium TaxID=2565924 RepID=A0A4S4A343_9FLAO|nr:helix-turn-helix domain-containing protein [Flavobacterium supellecticarium]THF52821.1 helix-turn-helix domain-containing protein [Flavobacterium supellecticarium]